MGATVQHPIKLLQFNSWWHRGRPQSLLTCLALCCSKCKVINSAQCCLGKLHFCCLTFAWINTTQRVSYHDSGDTRKLDPTSPAFLKAFKVTSCFDVIKCQITDNTFLCVLIMGFAGHAYLSHCCIMDISFIISCRSDSTGTCLIATTWPVSLWMALNTLP